MIEKLKKLFKEIPPNFDEIRNLLSANKFSKEELAEISNECVDNCFCEYRDLKNEVEFESMHSYYLLDSIKILLEHGLDPNIILHNDENVIWSTMWVDAPNIAASVMRLLLENGGNPNHLIPSEHETIFDYIDFKVSYDEYKHEFLHTVQCWLVLMGFGACWESGNIPLTMLGGHSVEIFKEFERFYYTIEPLPHEPGKYGCWIMHIYDTETNEEVARYC